MGNGLWPDAAEKTVSARTHEPRAHPRSWKWARRSGREFATLDTARGCV